MNDGVVLGSDAEEKDLVDAFDEVVTALGYSREDHHSDVDVQIWTHGARVCLAFDVPKSLGLAIARKLAKRLARDVRAFTASVVLESGGFECLVDDITVRPDGTTEVGRWGTDIVAEYGQNWDDLSDGKPHYAVGALMKDAATTSLGAEGDRVRYGFRAPASLGSERLDAIASQIRLAERVEVTVMAGRECVRVTAGGSTVTSFLAPEEMTALRQSGLV